MTDAPAIYLASAKFPANLAMAARLSACFEAGQVWYSGARMDAALAASERLPRELRMRIYPKPRHVANLNRALEMEKRPVAVELVDGAMALPDFDHSGVTAYVFGPEDGSLPQEVLRRCHAFIRIPGQYCLSLPMAVTATLYDRTAKLGSQVRP